MLKICQIYQYYLRVEDKWDMGSGMQQCSLALIEFVSVRGAGLLSVMDLVEVNPVLGASREAVEATAGLAVDVIASSLGQSREGATIAYQEMPSPKEDTEQLRL